MTGITEPSICILHSLQDSTASHFMVCNLHFALWGFSLPLPFFPHVWGRREGVLVTRRWLVTVGYFSISSAILELSVQLWQRGALLKGRNFPCVMKRCGTMGQEESGEPLPTGTAPSGCPPAELQKGQGKGRGHGKCRRWMGTAGMAGGHRVLNPQDTSPVSFAAAQLSTCQRLELPQPCGAALLGSLSTGSGPSSPLTRWVGLTDKL